jgi:hypothetical protein
MTKHKREPRMLSDADKARIQAGIAADTDNPEWTAKDFRRAKPFAKTFPGLAKSRRVRALFGFVPPLFRFRRVSAFS